MTHQQRTKPIKKGARITRVRPAGPDHQVVTVVGRKTISYRRTVCPTCPWRKDAVGQFPAEAFRHSANTAYDMAKHTFACHASGTNKPATCAGFLLHGSEHNLAVRLARIRGEIQDDTSGGGHDLFTSYTAMAIANGVPADDPCLAACRK